VSTLRYPVLLVKADEPVALQKPPSSWRSEKATPSLREVNRTIPVPQSFGFWRKMLAFSGPGFLIAVGYMDPGNWATDLAGGSAFGYTLPSVTRKARWPNPARLRSTRPALNAALAG
jgi:manganese transport protein